jgi:hypothetical protein
MQQQFYNKAHLANVFTGITDPKEHATVALMEVILYRNIFTEEHFAVTSEQPPSPDSSKRCDLVVNYLEEGSDNIRTFCFAECKRAKKSQPFSLKALEEQATDYCKAYVDYEDAPFVYAATMAGAHVRLWKYMQGDSGLTPFWGDNNEGDWQQYKDIGNDEDSRLVEDSFNNMKGWTPTPHAGQTSSDYSSRQPAIPDYSNSNYRYATSGTNPAQPTSGFSSGGSNVPFAYASQSAAPNSSSQYQWSGASGSAAGKESEVYEGRGGDAPDPSAWQDPDDMDVDQGTGDDRGSAYLVVRVTRVPHMTRSDEFLFKDVRGHNRSTTKSDWTKTKYGGKTAWLYEGKKQKYVTYDKIPT